MIADRRAPDQRRTLAENAAVILLGLLIVGNVMQAARIYDLFWEDASRAGYLAQAIPIVIYLAVAVYQRHWACVILAVAVSLVLVNSHTQFVRLSGTQENYNCIATFLPLLTFVPFVTTKVPMDRILRILLVVTTIYVVSYLILIPVVSEHYASNAFILLPSHGGDDRRLYLAAAYATFAMLYGLRANGRSLIVRAGLILIGAAALWLSDTRTMIVIVIGVFSLGAFKLLVRPVRVALYGMVLLALLLILLGFVFSDWNPYSAAISDGSGAYRAIEYSWVIRILEHNWLMGVGTPGKFIDLQLYLQRDFSVPRSIWIFATDLGPLGAYFQFGLIGLAVFFAAITFCMISPWKSTSPESQALQMTAFACAIYGISSPLLVMEPSAIFLLLLVAAWWRDRRLVEGRTPRRPRSRAKAV